MPITSKEVIETYPKANPTAEKFYNTLPAFLDLIQELFNRVLATDVYIRSIDKAIGSSINPKLLIAAALQALGLVDKEGKKEAKEAKETEETEEEVDKASKLELARSSIKGS